MEFLSEDHSIVKLTPKIFSVLSTVFYGWQDEDRNIELRIADPVAPISFIKTFREEQDKQLYIINENEDLNLWLNTWGGIALIQKELIERHKFLSSFLKPNSSFYSQHTCLRIGKTNS